MLTLKQILRMSRMMEQTGRSGPSCDRYGPVTQLGFPDQTQKDVDKKVVLVLEHVEDSQTGDVYIVQR